MEFFQEKIQTLRNKLAERGIDDPRLLGLVLLAVVGLMVVWNGARVVQQNYSLMQRVAVLEEENRILELENRNRELQINYYRTPEFAELKARRVNGKAAPGESVYVITEETALAGLKTMEPTAAAAGTEKPAYQENFEAWIDFFFGER